MGLYMVMEKKSGGLVFEDVGRAPEPIVPLLIRLSRSSYILSISPGNYSLVFCLEDLSTGRVGLTFDNNKWEGKV